MSFIIYGILDVIRGSPSSSWARDGFEGMTETGDKERSEGAPSERWWWVWMRNTGLWGGTGQGAPEIAMWEVE